MTLLELVLVVAVMAILAGMVVPLLGGVTDTAQNDGTEASLSELRDVIMGREGLPGFRADAGRMPTRLGELFVQPADLGAFNPQTRRGWRGPYIMNATRIYADPVPSANAANPASGYYGLAGDPAVADAWFRPIVLQTPADPNYDAETNARYVRLISAGPDGVITTSPVLLYPPRPEIDGGAARGDDIVVFLRVADATP